MSRRGPAAGLANPWAACFAVCRQRLARGLFGSGLWIA
jgi:hypothetical protein